MQRARIVPIIESLIIYKVGGFIKNFLKVTGLILIFILSIPHLATAGRRLDLSWGKGEGDSTRYRGAFALDWKRHWSLKDDIDLSGYWEIGIERWEEGNSLYAVSLIPVFRLMKGVDGEGRIYLFIDGAIGLYLLSKSTFGDKRFSTAFQFGDHLGIGFVMGNLEVGYRFEHLSNGGIDSPNPGINFHTLRLGYHF